MQVKGPLVHICEKAEAVRCLEATQGYTTQEQATLGFIHLSTIDLLLIPANRFYVGQSDLVLLLINPELLTAELRWEAGVPAEGDLLFPHLYGPLNPDSVVEVVDFPPGPSGLFSLPDQLKMYCS